MDNNNDYTSKKHDVGIVGYWYATNYGSVLTYYSLAKAISRLGYSAMLIDRPEKEKDPEGEDVFPRRFLLRHVDISVSVQKNEMHLLNDMCDSFVIGSDQVWTKDAIRIMQYMFFLDFADHTKRKVAYAPSFGNNTFNLSSDEYQKVQTLLNDFNRISVREDVGVKIVNDMFGCQADRVLDPVFLIDKDDYDSIANESKMITQNNYLLVYMLDPNRDKELAALKIAQKESMDIKVILDGRKNTFNHNYEKLQLLKDYVVKDVEEEDWVKLFANAGYVFTDSHHGLAMAIIYNKQLICYANYYRGYARFTSLMNLLSISDRLVQDSNDIEKILGKRIDYNMVNSIIKREKEKSLNWLKEAISIKDVLKNKVKKIRPDKGYNPDGERLINNPDFIKIRLLVSLLKDYGVKHIVLSPGGRDVPIIRMFEYNEENFVLHRVTDERSASYFGLGLAAQLRRPVACVCTSGTAVSNYLPAVTEAYYTGIPLIMITADRYGIYLNHGEDQTIPQKHVFDGVIKKSISLPENGGYLAEYQTRRDISDCILETTHQGNGPVHINVPIDNISIGNNVPRDYWKLLPFTYPHILRVSFLDGAKDMIRWVDCLKKTSKIMLVYGQNAPLSEQQKKFFDLFTEKYNCVVITDHISNVNNKYCIQPYNMLNKISQETFNNELAPEILITVGGKRLMNDPLTYKVRGCNKGIRHWSVTPDGKIKDFYFKLTSVIESSQSYFFEWFATNAGDIKNNNVYFRKWFDFNNANKEPRPIPGYNAHFAQKLLSEKLPANSVLHLGVGQSFFDIRRYGIKDSIEVFCNMGTNGIDGCTSTFLGQCAIEKEKLCFLLVGDLSFFYDMNSIWNKDLNKNVRIMMINNNGTDLLRGHNLKAVSSVHNTLAEGWVKSNPGFEYISARNPEEFEKKLPYFVSKELKKAVFFEVICD